MRKELKEPLHKGVVWPETPSLLDCERSCSRYQFLDVNNAPKELGYILDLFGKWHIKTFSCNMLIMFLGFWHCKDAPTE